MASQTRRFDVFNGDADGLCALQQLRLAEASSVPESAAAVLVTGVKRRIRLLEGLQAPAGARVTVLDVSFDANREDVARLLEAGCRVRYFDHHISGEVPAHPRLEAHIDTSPRICTSLLVDRYLEGAWRAWAVTGAFGDNLGESAREAAATLGVGDEELEELRGLGEVLNYNGYGEELPDLHFHPADLFRALRPYADPLVFSRQAPEAEALRRGFAADMAHAKNTTPVLEEGFGRVVLLPSEAWARRVQGVLANRLANEAPGRAHAVGIANSDGTLRLSVRAPLERPSGAGELCELFPSGGGRAGAGGVNKLPAGQLPRFLDAFRRAFG